MKTANLAIVFTDIKGFTERTSAQTMEENQRLLETHDRLLRPLFQSFSGRIIKSIGDAFMASFESPTQAVLCGVAIQDRLWLHNRGKEAKERLEVRVAVNVGEVRVESRDLFGEPVNIAARVEAITCAGEIYFTEAVYLAMNKAEVPSEEVGLFELKGIPGKIKVFRVPHAPYRVEAPLAPPGPEGPPSGATPELPPFGNLGLSRVEEVTGSRWRTDAGELATDLGHRAADLMERTGQVVKDATPGAQRLAERFRGLWVRRPGLTAPVALLALLLLGGLAVWAWPSAIERAISAAGRASPAERTSRVQAAEALIARVKDPGDRAFRRGQLTLALGRPDEASRRFQDAAQAGSARGREALVSLLGHERCEVRSDAASRLGQLGNPKARSPLRRLAANGGPGDSGGKALLGGLLGCNSKDAASKALERLE